MRKLRALLALVTALVMLGGAVLADELHNVWCTCPFSVRYSTPTLMNTASGTWIESRAEVTGAPLGILCWFDIHFTVLYTSVDGTYCSETTSDLVSFGNGAYATIPLPTSADISSPMQLHIEVFHYGATGGCSSWNRIHEITMDIPGISTCKHDSNERLLFDGLEYIQYTTNDNGYEEKHNVVHKLMDRHRGTCSKCGNVFYDYDNLRDEAHHLPACPCGYTQPGYNAVHSVRLIPMGMCCAGEDFKLHVITDSTVTRLTAINNTGVTLNMPWTAYENGDGTKTWSAVYTSNITAYEGRTWKATGYNARNRKIGEKTSEPLRIPVREDAARVTRCQQALKGYLELVDITRKQAANYSRIVGVDYTGITLWQVITRQSLEVTGNWGKTAVNAVSTAWADIPQSIFDMITGEFGYTAQVVDNTTNKMWRAVIFDMLNEESVEDPSEAGSTIIDTASDVWSSVDTILKEFTQRGADEHLEGLFSKLSKDATSSADILSKASKHYPALKDSSNAIIQGLNNKGKAFTSLSKVASWVPNTLNSLTNICAGFDQFSQAQELQEQYYQLMGDYNRSAKALIAIVNDAEAAGNERLRDVAVQMLIELADRYMNAQAQFVENIGTSFAAIGISGVVTGAVDFTETLFQDALKKLIGNGLAIAQVATSSFRALTNFDDVYEDAANLYIIYAMQQSMSLPTSWGECEYNFRTFQLMAQVHAAGCDAAIKFIDAHSGLGAGVEDLGIKSEEAKGDVLDMLRTEKQAFLDYAAEIERLSKEAGVSTGGGGR